MPDTPTQTTDRELWVLAEYLHEAYRQAEPGHRLYAAAQAADEWARERYAASRELLRQHGEMIDEINGLHERVDYLTRNRGEEARAALAQARGEDA